ncbi:MAG: alpha/beta hydrolase [Alcanivoracaceae bacterium]|nr:alpha/beta hydrolase [Alcanivoracaceae bacterium]
MKKILKITSLLVLLVLIALPFIYNKEKHALTAEIRANVDGEFIKLSQGIVHYQQGNSGAEKTVVLVHGFSVPYYIWDPTYDFLIANGFHVVRYDLYGRGYSDRPDVAYDQELFDTQLVELLDALNITKAVDMIGLSMGGAIVAKFVTDHPKKVHKVAFVDPSHEAFYSNKLAVPLVGEYLATVFMLPKAAQGQLADFTDPEKFTDWPEKYRQQMQYHGFRNALLSTLRYFAKPDKLYLYKKVGELNIPTLLIWGEDDKTLPLAKSPRVAKALNTETFVVKKAGHLPHFERSEIVNPKLLNFLNKQ